MHVIDRDGGTHELIQSPKRRQRTDRSLTEPASRRRRDLAILQLSKTGFSTGDIAVWFDLSERHVDRIIQRVTRFAEAFGYGKKSGVGLGRTTQATRV